MIAEIFTEILAEIFAEILAEILALKLDHTIDFISLCCDSQQ